MKKKIIDTIKGLWFIWLLVLIAVIPFVFNWLFQSDEETSWLFERIPSRMSVEFWGSFWIAYIAASSSIFVSICALMLSRRIQEIQTKHQLEDDRRKFRITDVMKNDNEDGLCVFLSLEVSAVNNVDIVKASLNFGNAEVLTFEHNEEKPINIKGCMINLVYPSDIDEKALVARKMWLEHYINRTPDYKYAILKIMLKYRADDLRPKEADVNICSEVCISIELNEHGDIYCKILDTAVYQILVENK